MGSSQVLSHGVLFLRTRPVSPVYMLQFRTLPVTVVKMVGTLQKTVGLGCTSVSTVSIASCSGLVCEGEREFWVERVELLITVIDGLENVVCGPFQNSEKEI